MNNFAVSLLSLDLVERYLLFEFSSTVIKGTLARNLTTCFGPITHLIFL